MGIHYINNTLVNDGQIALEQPEALIYEPIGNARKLVGVEYGWRSQPVWLNPFFELHVWAWRDNPQKAFVDWNNDGACELLRVTE